MPKPPLDEVLSVAMQGARSPLYEWLWADYDKLLPTLSRSGVNWAGLADLAKSHGVKAGRGLDPTAEIVRQTWARVRRVKEARKPRAKPAQIQATPVVQSAPVERERPKFQTITAKEYKR